MSRRVFDRDYRLSAVRLIVEDEMDVKEVSGLLDIHYNTLYRWVSEYEKYGQPAFPGNGVKIYDHQVEIRRLEKKNWELEEELELLKQFQGFLKRKKSVGYQYLKDNREKYNIKKTCRTLGISQSGFYGYLGRKPSKRDRENEVLSERIRSIFEKNDGRYGSIRISKSLEREGLHVDHKRVARLMRGMGLHAKGTRIRYRQYHRHAGNEERPNLVNQCSASPAPNKVWFGDITCIVTKEGFLYPAVCLDVFTIRVVGFSTSPKMAEDLAMDAFLKAKGG